MLNIIIRGGINLYFSQKDHSVTELSENLKLGSKNEQVRKLKKRLNELEETNLIVNDEFDSETLSAVNQFKQRYGLGNAGDSYGVVGKQTWEYLFSGLNYEISEKSLSYFKETRMAQIRLQQLGYPIQANGFYDFDMIKTINQFKGENGLSNEGDFEGVLGNTTWQWLFSSKAKKYSAKSKANSEIDYITEDKANPAVDTPLYNRNIKLVSQITQIEDSFELQLDKFSKIYVENENIYKNIAEKTGIPPELVAALHYRESTCNFNAYFHNGQILGKKTTIEPKGKLFYNFEDSALDAIGEKGIYIDKYKLTSKSNDILAMLSFAEVYNGLGYYNNGRISPYVYSGTNLYKSGKYIKDGVYDATKKDAQPGIYILIKKIKS